MKLLKQHFLKYLDLYIIVPTSVSSVILIYFNYKNIELPIAIFSAGFSISFAIRQYRIENDKIFKELFIMYNEKYDLKFNNYLNEIDHEVSKNSHYKLNEKQKPIIIDYLNLCAEEFLWHKKGRIDEVAWSSWERGMKYYLNIPAIKNFIILEKKQQDSYYGIFEYLNL